MKVLKTIIIILSLFISGQNFGQNFGEKEIKVNKKEFKREPLGYKEAWEFMNEGGAYYGMGPAGFRDARGLFLKANNYNDKNAELNYLIGSCFLYSDQKYEAAKYFQKAWELKPNVSEDIHFFLGKAYHMRMEWDNAIKEYTLFKNSLSPKRFKTVSIRIDKYIEECLNGKELVKKTQRVIVSSLGININSEFDDYASIINVRDSIMYFTSRRPSSNLEDPRRIRYDNKFPEQIYTSKKSDGAWEQSVLLGDQFNSGKYDDAAVAMNEEGTKVYTYYGKKNNGDIYLKSFDKLKNKWRKSRFKPISSKYKETSMVITAKEDTIYFITNDKRKKLGGFGGKDIYIITKDFENKWSFPKNLGSTINTPYDEEGLYLHPDGTKLYFSSKGHNSMGGFDVFVSKREKGQWGKPENIGYPINTPDDDLFFVMNRSNKYAYYSTNREGSVGEKDIFKVMYLGAEKETQLSYDNDLIAYFKYDKANIMRKPIDLLSIDSSIIMKGLILNAKTKEPIKDALAKLNLIDSEKSQIVGSIVSDNNGNYKINVPSKKKYAVEINCPGYLFFLELIDLTAEKGDVISKDFAITKIEVGEKVVLKNIFFETGKATLLPASYDELNKVLKLMTDNPKLRLEISGHTDDQGGLASNTKLSEGRAKTVVGWLVEKGIDVSRLEYKGYAFTQPISDNKTKAGRALNRRVEFKVLGIE